MKKTGGGGGRQGWRKGGYAGEVEDTEMTKNQNLRCLVFPFFFFLGGGGGRKSRTGQGEMLAGEWEQLFSYVTHSINLIYINLNFHQDIP